MRLLSVLCVRCDTAHPFATKLLWRIGRLSACPRCHSAWKLDRHLIWAATSTPAAIAAAVGGLALGTIGATAAFAVCFIALETVAFLAMRPLDA